MKQNNCVLPVQCVACGTTFDLWHDLTAHEGDMSGVSGEEEHFCWSCRQMVMSYGHRTEVASQGIEVESGDELELTWE